jgi:hypothetical protein
MKKHCGIRIVKKRKIKTLTDNFRPNFGESETEKKERKQSANKIDWQSGSF